MSQLDLSSRAYHSILNAARTIADLVGSEGISRNHLLEAIQYRRFGERYRHFLELRLWCSHIACCIRNCRRARARPLDHFAQPVKYIEISLYSMKIGPYI
jgi:hypothetical protein